MKRTLTLLLLMTCITCYGQKFRLQLNLEKDSTYYMTSNVNLTITEDIQGQQQIITTIISGRIAHKVTAVKDSVYEMEVQYESLAMHMDMGSGRIMDVNTDDKDKQDVFSKIMLNMMHKPFSMTINRTGKVLDIKNIENIYAGIFDNFPDISEAKKAQIKSQLQQSFGDKAFKGSFQDDFAVLPGIAVAVNDKWIINTTLESMISAKIKTSYMLVGIAGNAFVIHGDAAISTDDAGFKQYNGMPVRYNNMIGTATADYKLDKITGWITEAKIAKLIKGTMEIKDNPMVPGGMSFPMTIAGDIAIANK